MRPAASPFRRTLFRVAVGLMLLPVHAFAQTSPDPDDAIPDGKPTFVVPEIAPGADLKIIAYGDMRFTKESNVTDTNPHVRKWLAEKVGSEKPDLLFLSGDMPMTGANPWDWKDYRRETASWTENKLRVFPTLGNHEAMEGLEAGLANYFATYPELKGHRYYSVLAGSVELIAIDTLQKVKPGSPQFAWLQAQLANIPPQVNFVFFLLHMPLMADVQSQVVVNLPSPEMFELRTFLEEQAAKSHARFITVSGHIHNYERFQHGHITYLVSGGGGARPYPILVRGPQDLYRDDSYPNFHYITLMIHGKRLDATMYRVVDPTADKMTVEVKDRFALEAK